MQRNPSVSSPLGPRSKSMWSLSDKSWGRTSSISGEKTKLTQLLKTTQLEQLSKLQAKHQQECDLLDDIRNFAKQRSQLEKEYGQALAKLVLQYQKKEWPIIPESNEAENIPVAASWKAVLDSTDKAAQARMVASDKYKNNISEAVKNCRVRKELYLKKCQDLVNDLQNEITESVRDLTKSKKRYFDLEFQASGSREKVQDVNDRLKKNHTGIFKSKFGLEKTLQKMQQKSDENTAAAVVSRNEYILALAATNAHQKRYYEVDMPEAIRVLDGDVYNRLQEFIGFFSRYELDASDCTQTAFVESLNHSTRISREHNSQLFLRENPVFEWGPLYKFESCAADPNSGDLIAEQPGDDNSLNREARKWAAHVVREKKQLVRLKRIRAGLESLTDKYVEQPDLAAEANVLDAHTRLEKCKKDTRKVEAYILRSNARLQCLRDANVDIDSWIKSAETQAEKEMPATNSRIDEKEDAVRRHRQLSEQNSTENRDDCDCDDAMRYDDDPSFFDEDFCDDDTFDDTCNDDDDDDDGGAKFGVGDNLSIPSSDRSRNYPISCTVSYAYEATRADELTIEVGDRIEVVEDGDLDQWVKAKDGAGRVGYVPEYYLDFSSPPSSSGKSHHQYSLPPGEALPNHVRHGAMFPSAGAGSEAGSSTSGTSSLAACSLAESGGGNDYNGTSAGERNPSAVSSDVGAALTPEIVATPAAPLGVCLARAVYEYEACDDEQISFPEGAVINVLTKNDNGVDDGWWKGELNGKIGVFPSIVVEELAADSQPPATSLSVVDHRSHSPSFGRQVNIDSPTQEEAPPGFRPLPPPAINNRLHPAATYGTLPGARPQALRYEVSESRAYSAPPSPVSYSQVSRNNSNSKPARSAPPPPQPKRPIFLNTHPST